MQVLRNAAAILGALVGGLGVVAVIKDRDTLLCCGIILSGVAILILALAH